MYPIYTFILASTEFYTSQFPDEKSVKLATGFLGHAGYLGQFSNHAAC